jgi:glycosyltransferase involved in cell wall biosynthesis
VSEEKELRIGFIMPTEVGWQTQYLNWRKGLTKDLGVAPEWIVINWWKEGGLLERIPLLPAGVKARIRSQMELRAGLLKGPFDALFVGVGHVLHGGKGFLSRQPYFITTDVTPLQLHNFGDLYGITGSRFKFYEQRKHLGWVDRYQNAAGIFACSEWAAKSMIEDYGVDPSRVFVLPPGIDTNHWKFPDRDNTSGPTNILFVGGHFHRKGGDLLLKWAETTQHSDWMLHLVTRDKVSPNHPSIKVYNGLSPNDPALMDLYRQAHLFALPTRGDCYSLASMEAMSAGLPVILSRTGGTGDIIKQGETGYLIEPGDGKALSEHLDYLLANPEKRAEMGLAARQDAEERYDADKNIHRTVSLMRQTLNRSRAAKKNLRLGFVMSTEVGWKTQYLNWRDGLTPALGVDPEWIVINWWDQSGLLENLPLMPPGMKARIRSHIELRAGLTKGPFDALFIGVGHVLHGGQRLLARQPYFITSDVTPIQLHKFGKLYGIMRTRFEIYERKKYEGWRDRYRNAAALFPWSNWAGKSMIEDYGADPSKVHVIPPGVDISKWKAGRRDNSGPVNILFVGGEYYRKGGDLLEEWADRTKTKDWHIHLVTRDPIEVTNKNITVYRDLSPNDERLMELYRQADIFVLPTRGDCYSIAAIEGMASGLPVILSRTGGTEDIVTDGKTGFLVEPGNSDHFVDRLDYLLAHPEERIAMGCAARLEAEQRYDAAKNIRRTLSIMRECLGDDFDPEEAGAE